MFGKCVVFFRLFSSYSLFFSFLLAFLFIQTQTKETPPLQNKKRKEKKKNLTWDQNFVSRTSQPTTTIKNTMSFDYVNARLGLETPDENDIVHSHKHMQDEENTNNNPKEEEKRKNRGEMEDEEEEEEEDEEKKEGGGDAGGVVVKRQKKFNEEQYYTEKMVKARRAAHKMPHADIIQLVDDMYEAGIYSKKSYIKPKRAFHAPMAPKNEEAEAMMNKAYPAKGIEDFVDEETGEEFMDKIDRYKTMIGVKKYEMNAVNLCAHRYLNPRCIQCGKCDPNPKYAPSFKICAKCNLAFYCSIKCAKDHRHRHESVCLNPYMPQADSMFLTVVPKLLKKTGKTVLLYKYGMRVESPQDLAKLPDFRIGALLVQRPSAPSSSAQKASSSSSSSSSVAEPTKKAHAREKAKGGGGGGKKHKKQS